MLRKALPEEIKQEMERVGGSGNDYFTARAFLENQFAAADLALEKIKAGVVKHDDDSPWPIEPSLEQVEIEAKTFGMTIEDARSSVRGKLSSDARRLSTFSNSAAAEISKALAEASAARERAENVLAEHESTLAAVTSGIMALGHLRKKISSVRALGIGKDQKQQMAFSALSLWIDKTCGYDSAQVSTSFLALCQDLSYRQILNDYIETFVLPLEQQVQTLIASIRSQAAASNMDLKQVLQLLASENGVRPGISLLSSEFYGGLI